MDYYCFPTRTGDVSVFFDLEQYTNYRERFFLPNYPGRCNASKAKRQIVIV